MTWRWNSWSTTSSWRPPDSAGDCVDKINQLFYNPALPDYDELAKVGALAFYTALVRRYDEMDD